MLEGGPKFHGIIGLNNHDNNYDDLSQGFYHKLGENSNMSIDSYDSLQTSNGGRSVAMSIESIGSNDSHTRILNHQGLRRHANDNYSVQRSVNRNGRVTRAFNNDALAHALMDSNSPTEGLENFDNWTIDLRKLNMGRLLLKELLGNSIEELTMDLKSDNLLIFGDKSIKIADFGVARIEVQTEGMTPETGTYRWMAPEMIQHRPYTQKVDVYSFGIVLWELITGMLPFQNMTAVQAAFAVVNKGVRPVPMIA
ncbi:hypothetical protein GH714_033527 [Hevea brasiliensis]|uniref:Protein kinase domain-containing protein n=1 Tax=Hevea brasiliensis TaxID=3981 RepID=A0A6A6MQS2_HEVBR|nr:hypothetical protein GH714_033527 [Hevea brasiliensis]